MRFVETTQQKSLDYTVENLTKLVEEYQAKIEEVKKNLIVWEGEENETDEDQEVDTTGGKMILGPGDFLFKHGAKSMVVPKEMANNKELWLEVED